MFHDGLICRPRSQEELHRKTRGSRPLILSPELQGVELHHDYHSDPVKNPRWTQDDDHPSWNYIKERYTTTDTVLKYELAVSKSTYRDFSPSYEAIAQHAPKRTQKSGKPLKLTTTVDWYDYEDPVSIEPDDYFVIHASSDDYLFLESCEGTETIRPHKERLASPFFFNNTSHLQKYVVYANVFRNFVHQDQLGISSFRVLTVTTTPKRVQQIIRRCYPFICEGAHAVNPGLFLFTDRETIAAYNNDPLEVPHLTMAGKEVYLGK